MRRQGSHSSFQLLGKHEAIKRYELEKRQLSQAFEVYTNEHFATLDSRSKSQLGAAPEIAEISGSKSMPKLKRFEISSQKSNLNLNPSKQLTESVEMRKDVSPES